MDDVKQQEAENNFMDETEQDASDSCTKKQQTVDPFSLPDEQNTVTAKANAKVEQVAADYLQRLVDSNLQNINENTLKNEETLKKAVNDEVTKYLANVEFKHVLFNGLDSDDVYEKVRYIILKVRDICWTKFAVEFDETAKCDVEVNDDLLDQLSDVIDEEVASRLTVIRHTTAEQQQAEQRQAEQRNVEQQNRAEQMEKSRHMENEALELLKQARIEAAAIKESTQMQADKELLAIRSQLANEKTVFEQEQAERLCELDMRYQEKTADLEKEYQLKQAELETSYQKKMRGLQAEEEQISQQISKMELVRGSLERKIAVYERWLDEIESGYRQVQETLNK